MKRYVIALVVMVSFAAAVWAQAPKKAYLVGQIDVTNAQQYAEYAKLTPALLEKHGARFLARAGRSVTLEGTQAPSRVVVIEFPSFEKAQEFYNSAEYQAAKKVRAGAAAVQFVIVEGL